MSDQPPHQSPLSGPAPTAASYPQPYPQHFAQPFPQVPPMTPVDPNALTTAQLLREMVSLRTIMETRINAVEKAADVFAEGLGRVPTALDREISKVSLLTEEKFHSIRLQLIDRDKRQDTNDDANKLAITTALTANKEALDVMRMQLAGLPAEQAKNIDHLRGMQDTKIDALARQMASQFEERDIRSRAAETAASVAVSAALNAQKESSAQQNESLSASIAKSESAMTKQLDGIVALLGSNNNSLSEKIAAINGRLDRSEGKSTGLTSTMATGIAAVAVLVSLLAATGALRSGGGSNSGSGAGYSGQPLPGPVGSQTVPLPTPR